MKARAGSGWQWALADLSLILFLLTASALSQAGPATRAEARPVPARAAGTSVPLSEPVAVYRPGPDAPPIGRWLAEASSDPRLQLTITVYANAPDRAAALAQASALADAAQIAGRPARIVAEPGDPQPIVATLAYDAAPTLAPTLPAAGPTLARPLRDTGHTP
ncbi:hypothetical protein [Novosphingobium lentum]|uniref:hypothetical protein n=1 Tax=Novosphingobium lentum TaxID=145287 RepID=UPI0008378B3F|nr:hypothetical protein [Novosphingobium lentum]